ncbi:hypothetical protein HZ996_11580 [Cryomorphaceae bacterium]|nr:hypothetical protein HZ996_11580 [Cryomorphaceae bacterium]
MTSRILLLFFTLILGNTVLKGQSKIHTDRISYFDSKVVASGILQSQSGFLLYPKETLYSSNLPASGIADTVSTFGLNQYFRFGFAKRLEIGVGMDSWINTRDKFNVVDLDFQFRGQIIREKRFCLSGIVGYQTHPYRLEGQSIYLTLSGHYDFGWLKIFANATAMHRQQLIEPVIGTENTEYDRALFPIRVTPVFIISKNTNAFVTIDWGYSIVLNEEERPFFGDISPTTFGISHQLSSTLLFDLSFTTTFDKDQPYGQINFGLSWQMIK